MEMGAIAGQLAVAGRRGGHARHACAGRVPGRQGRSTCATWPSTRSSSSRPRAPWPTPWRPSAHRSARWALTRWSRAWRAGLWPAWLPSTAMTWPRPACDYPRSGIGELEIAGAAGHLARGLAIEGVAQVASGAVQVGEGATMEAVGAALAERAA